MSAQISESGLAACAARRLDSLDNDYEASSSSAEEEEDEEDLCKICMDRPRTVRNRPCGHTACCELCTIETMEPAQRSLRCPICRINESQLEMRSADAEQRPSHCEEDAHIRPAAQPGARASKAWKHFCERCLTARCQGAEKAAGVLSVGEVEGEVEAVVEEEGEPAYPIVAGHATVPEGVTEIGNYAFDGCRSLTSVTIPSSVTRIGWWAFASCSSLTSVDIPSSVTSIGVGAFQCCSSLTSVAIPSSVTEICGQAFSGCSSLTSVDIPSSVTEIGWHTFSGCSSLTSVDIPSSVTRIGDYAFRGCSSLTSVAIPSSVTRIDEYAFHGCSSLTSVTIPSSVTRIGDYAFLECSSLTSVTIPSSVTRIGDYAPRMLLPHIGRHLSSMTRFGFDAFHFD